MVLEQIVDDESSLKQDGPVKRVATPVVDHLDRPLTTTDHY